jgi:hypothetical protein
MVFKAVLGNRIRMFLGLLDPDPDPLVKYMDTDPSTNKKIVRKTLIPTARDFFLTFYL